MGLEIKGREMPKANKTAKAAGKAAIAKPDKDQPVLHAIKGGKAPPAKTLSARPAAKAISSKPGAKPIPLKPVSAAADDAPVIGLNLATAKLSPAMAAYFKKCQDKLGFVPNVLVAYAFDMRKLETFVAMYNDLMLGESGLSKLEREMIAVVVSSQNRCYYCLTAHVIHGKQVANLRTNREYARFESAEGSTGAAICG